MVRENSITEVWNDLRQHYDPVNPDNCYIAAITRRTSLTRRTVNNVIDLLEDMGLIERVRHENKALITLRVDLAPRHQDADSSPDPELDPLDPAGNRWTS